MSLEMTSDLQAEAGVLERGMGPVCSDAGEQTVCVCGCV